METLASRVLPQSSRLFPGSCCPTRDLIALAAPSTSVSEAKVTLWRTMGAADTVWDWNIGGGGGGTTKGKRKEIQAGEVTAMVWDAKGDYLAVGISNTATTPSTSTFALLSVHTGILSLPPIALPGFGAITYITWQILDHAIDSKQISFATELILKLPNLPLLPGKGAPVGGAAAAASGVFGSAKNAALLKEREKEAGRILELKLPAPTFPTLLEIPKNELGEREKATMLLVGDDQGKVHVYFGGSVFLGSLDLGANSRVVGASILPSTSTSTRIAVLLTNSSNIRYEVVQLALPPTLEVLAEQSTHLHALLQHAFESLQSVKVAWDESRRIGKAWMARLAELGQAHSVTSHPVTQLLMLLMTGRPSRALHDFLASKMNERALGKWEHATATALAGIKNMFMSLTPATERALLLLDEIRAWGIWPEKFGKFQLEVDQLKRCISLASEVIIASHEAGQLAIEEERCFNAFRAWLRYELEKVALQEGSDVRPSARFQPIPVAHYIRHCLPESLITPFLSFGLASVPLSSNRDLAAARSWYDALRPDHIAKKEPLDLLMKRMKEELKGQADRARAFSSDGAQEGESDVEPERPPREEEGGVLGSGPKALPVLLHLLAEKVSLILASAMQKIGEAVEKESDPLVLGKGGERTFRETILHDDRTPYHAWLEGKILRIVRRSESEAAVSFAIASFDETIEIIDFAFFDVAEMLFLLKVTKGTDVSYNVSTVPLGGIGFSFILESNEPERLEIEVSHALDSHFPPQGIAVNGARRSVCVIMGDGRRLEVLEYFEDQEDDEEEAEQEEVGDDDDEEMEL